MNSIDSQRELLLRHLDGRVTPEERARVLDWLRTDPDARAFLREVAKQAVGIADCERTARGRQEQLQLRARVASATPGNVTRVDFRGWPRAARRGRKSPRPRLCSRQ